MSKTKQNTMEKLVTKAALRIVQLVKIGTDSSYQREIKNKHKRIVADFNAEAFGIPVAGQREDGSLWIVDGLQRISALRKMGKTEVRIEVFASRGPEHEAEVFKVINMNRAKLTSAEEFRCLLTAHDPTAWAVKEVGEKCGFTLQYKCGKKPGPTSAMQLTCFTLLLDMAKRYGTQHIAFTLDCIKASWPDDPLGVYNTVVGGLCIFSARHDGVADGERMIARMRTTTPQKVIYTTQQMATGTSRHMIAADVFDKIYQKRRAMQR